VQVIRSRGEPIIDRTATGYDVRLPVTMLGQLADNGVFQPQRARNVTFTFKFGDNYAERQSGLFVTEAPAEVLLSDEALQLYFELRTLYFWSADHQVLVPDLRYLPRRDVPAAQRPTLIIEWLLRGPSPWLRQAVDPLPADAGLVGRVPAPTDGVLRVDLSKAADIGDADQVARLATQLRWSLRTGSGTDLPVQLRVDQVQKLFTEDTYLAANPAYRSGREPLRYCVLQGRVRPLGGAPSAPQVPARWNSQVLRAAFGRDGDRTLIALLRSGSGGRVVLDVGGASGRVDALSRVELPGQATGRALGQPVWLPGAPETALVLVDGQLLAFRATGGAARQVQRTPGQITSYAVPPDGRRLAYVSGGRLYVAPLLRVGGTVAVGEPRQEVPTSLSTVTAVGWSQQDWLVVAGRRSDTLVAFQDITVDGATQGTPRGGQFGTQLVSHLVASADDPANGRGAGQVMYMVANGLSYELYSQERQLTAADVAGPQSTTGTAGAAGPTYPFYLD
jgi:hypothetical protein